MSLKIYPGPGEWFCVVCDDMREETSGKITLVGVYGDEIRFNTPDPKAMLQPTGLAFVFVIRKGQGDFKMRAVLETPSKKQELVKERIFEKPKDRSANFAFRVVPFRGEPGDYY